MASSSYLRTGAEQTPAHSALPSGITDSPSGNPSPFVYDMLPYSTATALLRVLVQLREKALDHTSSFTRNMRNRLTENILFVRPLSKVAEKPEKSNRKKNLKP